MKLEIIRKYVTLNRIRFCILEDYRRMSEQRGQDFCFVFEGPKYKFWPGARYLYFSYWRQMPG